MRIGFASVDITPPLGTHKIGWLRDILPDRVADPLFAHVAVFDDGRTRAGLVQLDTLSTRWSDVADIRRRVAAAFAFPGDHLLVGATHNHGGPAVAETGEVGRDAAYLEELKRRVVGAVGEALGRLAPAELGYQRSLEYRLSHNRRVVMRNGLVRTHGNPRDPEALFVEGPIDPEVSVLSARAPGGGALLGAIVNFACHPTHQGGEPVFTSGWPGALNRELAARGLPGSVFLQGACGNLSSGHPSANYNPDQIEFARVLADDVLAAIGKTENYGEQWPLRVARATVQLPYRRYTPEEVAGTLRGAQRFIDPAIYDRGMPRLKERIATRGTQPAEVQAIAIGEVVYVSFPCEYFVEFALRLKRAAYPARVVVVGYANGMVGYVPTAEAFAAGGYETTFALSSRQAPEAGELLYQAAMGLVKELRG
jgi:hypothetical protein